jgi:hypothetical protein
MEYLKKPFILVLALLTLTCFLPQLSIAQEDLKGSDVPNHEPQSWSTPEQEIPTVKEKKTSGWTWLILLGLVGGAAAAAGSGGGDGGSSGGEGGTGSYTGTW